MSFEAYSFWDEDYTQLEQEFLDIITYVPLDINHSDVWSLKLANLLILIGSSIDSFLQSAMCYCLNCIIKNKINNLNRWNYNYYLISDEIEVLNRLFHGGEKVKWTKIIKGTPKTYKIRIKRININDYKNVFEDFYKLSEATVYLLRSWDEIKPFEAWVSHNETPDWWKVYRDLKHNKFKNKKEATLKIVLDALAAFFIINLYHIESRNYLINNTEIFETRLDLRRKDFLSPKMKLDSLESAIAKTPIFGFIIDREGSIFKDKPWFILDPKTGSDWLY